MSLAVSRPSPEPITLDRILVVGDSPQALDLLRLATICSDEIVLIGADPTPETRLYAARFAIEWIARPARADDLPGHAAILVGERDIEAANTLVRAARRARVPVHVSGRPLVSDFSLLEFLERRAPAVAAPRRPDE